MDATAFAMCQQYGLGIIVFDMTKPGNIQRVVCGEPVGTRVVTDNQQTELARGS